MNSTMKLVGRGALHAAWIFTLAAFLALLVTSCAGPGQGPTAQVLLEAAQAAAADGVVTPEEQEVLAKLVSPGVDWASSLVQGVLSIGGALLGVKVLPSRVFQGPFDSRPATPA